MSKKDPLEGFGWNPDELKNHDWIKKSDDEDAWHDDHQAIAARIIQNRERDVVAASSFDCELQPQEDSGFRTFQMKHSSGTSCSIRVDSEPLPGYGLSLEDDDEVDEFCKTVVLDRVEALWNADSLAKEDATYEFENNGLKRIS